MLKNASKSFGNITKLLHWLILALIVAQFYLIWVSIPINPPEKAYYMMLHKSLGITTLLFGLLFIIWHIVNTKPLPPKNQPHWQHITAKIVHHLLFILLIIMPIVGYLLVCANGRIVNFFGWFNLPSLIPKNEYLRDLMFSMHQKMGYLILILVGIHFLAALYHHFIVKDKILVRMLPFSSEKHRKKR